MQPVNPFLRGFFKSGLAPQCQPISQHILLVPPTELLLHSRDRESGSTFVELATTEEFLASHVLQVPGGQASGLVDKSSPREIRGKAKQYLTINGRTVVVKDNFLYSNKGFKSLNQSQLLGDALHYADTFDNQQWLIYFISKPLVGIPELAPIVPAILSTQAERDQADADKKLIMSPAGSSTTPVLMRKKIVKTFADLMDQFPIIAHNMTPGLDRIFKVWADRFDAPLPAKTSRPASIRSHGSATSLKESLANLQSSISSRATTLRDGALSLEPEEEAMREALEAAVSDAIDIFQGVDKQQLALVGTTTDLSGPAVERLIERYVTEHIHDRGLFSRLCQIKREDDSDLEHRMRRMLDIDVAQVGIAIEGGQAGKHKLATRIEQAVAMFKKEGVASSPQEMTETLLATQKIIATGGTDKAGNDNESEKRALAMTMNADTLVSMLLLVVIRSGVKHLHARLTYMKHFVFTDEVETGETGYAISTFEAVLLYLAEDSGPLKRASRRNNELWSAVAQGNLPKLQSILEPFSDHEPISVITDKRSTSPVDMRSSELTAQDSASMLSTHSSLEVQTTMPATTSHGGDFAAVGGSLEHVFPFQRPPTPPPDTVKPKRKRVVMAVVRNGSVSSIGAHSRSASSNSALSDGGARSDADTSLETLAQTQNLQGDSLLMMAIEAVQYEVLRYLLGLEEHYSIAFVLEDCNVVGTTLLSAAVQASRKDITNLLLDHIIKNIRSHEDLEQYLAKQDDKGRCVAHYLFNQPELLERIGGSLPWRLRDNNGQTPLFALCRSYDHPLYHNMVNLALHLTTQTQPDMGALHLDDHVDGKSNTLLHIVNDPGLTALILKHADVDVNAANDKRFTPFMVASKYGKVDLARVIFSDPRVETQTRDLRGLSAIDLAKDDEIRNKIDDMVLLSKPIGKSGRITTVVRSLFVDDATVRVILKSGSINDDGTVTVTTCRRSLSDFLSLAGWLAVEQPASWIPTPTNLASPFMIPSKPSRALLYDIQLRLDNFLRTLLTHPTFSTHEAVWEFFLVPDIDPAMLAERSKHKAEVRVEKIRDEYDPITDTAEVEIFVAHAHDQVRRLSTATRQLIRRVNRQRQGTSDNAELSRLATNAISTLTFLPASHKTALSRHARTLSPTESEPTTALYYALDSQHACVTALLTALQRPTNLVGSMEASRRDLDRTLAGLARQSRWTPNIGFFDDTRKAIELESRERVDRTRRELETLGSELRYTQQTVAAELAGWQEARVETVKGALREFARTTVVRERDRLDGMRRALRVIRVQQYAAGRG